MSIAFVTGAAGQDGSYLVERLLAEGTSVHALVREGDEVPIHLPPQVELHSGDLGRGEQVAELVEQLAPDEVFNLGGVSSVGYSWDHPVETSRVTGEAVVHLLDACDRLGARGHRVRFLQASSSEIFGHGAAGKQNEESPLRPTSPYGAAKAFAHHMVGVYRGRGLHACSVILYNHESPRRPPTFVTRKITQAAVAIAGGAQEHVVLGDLRPRRDWGWAPDYVDGALRAIRHRDPDDFVLASGTAHSVEEFVARAFSAVGLADWRPYVRFDESFVRPAEPTSFVGDADKAKRVLGWEPTVGFDELVTRMVDGDRALVG